MKEPTQTNLFKEEGNKYIPFLKKGIFVWGKTKKAAFTLAEILITLAVIGVVAALTIPTLINKYNQTVTETRLKQFYSSMNQAIQLSEIDNGSKTTWDFNEYCPTGSEYSEECLTKNFEKFFKPYLKFTDYKYSLKLPIYVGTDLAAALIVYFQNGSAVAFQYKTNDLWFFPIASNLEKKGKRDKDYFLFGFYPNGTSSGNVFCKAYYKGKGMLPYVWSDYDGTEENAPCLRKVQLNGWKFPDECNPWK